MGFLSIRDIDLIWDIQILGSFTLNLCQAAAVAYYFFFSEKLQRIWQYWCYWSFRSSFVAWTGRDIGKSATESLLLLLIFVFCILNLQPKTIWPCSEPLWRLYERRLLQNPEIKRQVCNTMVSITTTRDITTIFLQGGPGQKEHRADKNGNKNGKANHNT